MGVGRGDRAAASPAHPQRAQPLETSRAAALQPPAGGAPSSEGASVAGSSSSVARVEHAMASGGARRQGPGEFGAQLRPAGEAQPDPRGA
eukprot:9215651-Pyramimonas_sp.AAC.1